MTDTPSHTSAHAQKTRGLPLAARLALAAVASVGLAGLVGAVLAVVGRYLYVPSLWPALGAVAVGAGIMALMRALRIAGRGQGAWLGGGAGLASIIALLAVAWSVESAAIVSELSRTGGLQGHALSAKAAALLAERAGSGVLAPVWLRLHDGVLCAPGLRVDLGTVGNAALLALELALAMAIAGRLGFVQGGRPFAAACDAWLTRRVVGVAPHGSAASIQSELKEGLFHRLGRRLGPPTQDAPVVLCVWVCDGHETDVMFELEVLEAGARKPRVVETRTATHAALDAILESQAMRRPERAT
jgi:hypothetical protein